MTVTISSSPNSGPFRKSLFLAVGMLVPAPDARGLGTAKEHPSHAMCRAVEKTSSLPSTPITGPIPQPPCPARPHGCWPSCSPTEDVCSRSQQALVAEGSARPCPGAARPGRGRLRVAGSRARRGSRTPTGCTLAMKCHDPPPPREGVRPRPRRAAGPQRQGPHPGLRAAPGAPATASRANTAARSPAPSWRCLEALLWGFHNARSGRCFPCYEAIAAKAECARNTVYEALKVLEWAGVLTWQNRIARIQVRERDLFGRWASRWRVIRTSNAYVFRDPLAASRGRSSFQVRKSDREHRTKKFLIPVLAPARDPDSPLERALQQLGGAIKGRLLMNGSGGMVPAT